MLAAALAHRSWCSENPGHDSNERLEFLGDAVLGLVVTDLVFERFPELDEGALTDLRKSVVNAVALADVATDVGLGDWILLGKGEEQSGGREKPSILSDAFEAVIGAIYLDGGLGSAVGVVRSLLTGRIDQAAEAGAGVHDHKSRLQEQVAQQLSAVPVYRASGSGPDHARTFEVTVEVLGRTLGHGQGRSKKQAEQIAARAALETLESDPPDGGVDAAASDQRGTPGA